VTAPSHGQQAPLPGRAPRGLAVAVAVAVVGTGVVALVGVFWRPEARQETGPGPAPPAAALAGPPRLDAAGAADAGAPVHPAAARPKLGSEQIAQLNEAVLMARLRDVATADPGAAVQLAREGNRRFPDSPEAPERESILIHALSALDRPSEARGQAELMVNHYPDSAWVREIEAFTGAHRHRNLRFNDAGQIVAE
jgi:hypothetical protein